jgi:putative transposase
MPMYRRVWEPGGCYFFTVNLQQRGDNDLLVRHVDILRESVRKVRSAHPFRIHGWVVLPGHLHCVLQLPDADDDFIRRWRLIKSTFSRKIPHLEHRNPSRIKREERAIWQRRFWEHCIRDEQDYRAHMDYVHINPVKHGLVSRVQDWPYSTFHHWVRRGVYAVDWAGGSEGKVDKVPD